MTLTLSQKTSQIIVNLTRLLLFLDSVMWWWDEEKRVQPADNMTLYKVSQHCPVAHIEWSTPLANDTDDMKHIEQSWRTSHWKTETCFPFQVDKAIKKGRFSVLQKCPKYSSRGFALQLSSLLPDRTWAEMGKVCGCLHSWYTDHVKENKATADTNKEGFAKCAVDAVGYSERSVSVWAAWAWTLLKVLTDAVNKVNLLKTKPLIARLFSAVCEQMKAENSAVFSQQGKVAFMRQSLSLWDQRSDSVFYGWEAHVWSCMQVWWWTTSEETGLSQWYIWKCWVNLIFGFEAQTSTFLTWQTRSVQSLTSLRCGAAHLIKKLLMAVRSQGNLLEPVTAEPPQWFNVLGHTSLSQEDALKNNQQCLVWLSESSTCSSA